MLSSAIVYPISYPESLFPSTSGQETSDTVKIRSASPETSDCRCLEFSGMLYFCLTSAGLSGMQKPFKTLNLTDLCRVRRSFFQACEVTNEDSGFEIVVYHLLVVTVAVSTFKTPQSPFSPPPPTGASQLKGLLERSLNCPFAPLHPSFKTLLCRPRNLLTKRLLDNEFN